MRQAYPITVLQEVLNDYSGLGSVTDHYLFTSGFENTSYYVATDTGKYVVKIYEAMGATTANVLFEINVMDYVYKSGIKIPRVLDTKAGSLYSIINGKYVIVMDFVDGMNMEKKEISDQVLAQVAEQTGKMDAALANYKGAEATRVNYEFDLKNFLMLEDKVGLLSAVFEKDMFIGVFNRFRDIKPAFDSQPAGLIHNDIVLHNLLVKDNQLQAIIDFGDIAFSPYIQNVAVAFCHTIFAYNYKPHQAKLFLDAYTKYRTVSAAELQLLFDLVLARFAMLIVEFNRWNIEYGEDQLRTEFITDHYAFMKRFSEFGRDSFNTLLA